MEPRKLISLFGAVLLVGIAPVVLRAQSNPGKKRTDPYARSSVKSNATSAKKSYVNTSGKKTHSKSSKSRRREKSQKAPTADRIQEIQSALATYGVYSGAPNGKWDADSVEATKKFQAANGLNPTGKVDALTLQKLGLGSDVAGRAPPRPPVSSPAASASHP